MTMQIIRKQLLLLVDDNGKEMAVITPEGFIKDGVVLTNKQVLDLFNSVAAEPEMG